MYHNMWTLWNTQDNPWYDCNQHFFNYASDEGQYQLKYQIWDWFRDKSCLPSLYWSASQLEDPQNSVHICAIENHPNVIYI